MVKPKASWKGLDREFCCPVTCAKLYNIVTWLTNPNIIWLHDMIILNYISFIVSYVNMLLISLIQCSIWYMILMLEIQLNVGIKIHIILKYYGMLKLF